MSGSGKGPKVLVILIYIGVMAFDRYISFEFTLALKLMIMEVAKIKKTVNW